MVIKSAELDIVCGITSTLPRNELPEIAFSGKSNVGKSSLLNGLLNRKALARTSATPGKTQTINYYLVNKELYFVDLPGYGYAKVSQVTREKWGSMIEKYLKRSPSLKAVFLLIDIRHEPGANDRQMYEWVVANGFKPVIIATKSDKIPKSQINKQTSMILKELGCPAGTVILPFSALNKSGRDEIWAEIERILDGKTETENKTED
ncbi:MAG: ribosome biogenesis GTP-binding protein YihA/YsxC [Lachnospiraceae bacterium]|nr:ribosome biogenesis GTP-binding protein YihA/YsxC [Lachnospiraceae bacterium]